MTIRVSSGLSRSMLSTYGLTSMMDYGVIDIYSGAQPASASNAPTGTRLAQITNDGDVFIPTTAQGGLRIVLGDAGGLIKSGTWRMKGIADGTAGWWRWKWNEPDDDSNSLYYPRLDGAVGESLILQTTSITTLTNVVIDEFYLNFLE